MPQVHVNGIDIAYEAHGDPANPPLLLIMGLGAQLTLWPIELVEALVARGYYVIRHDNRDIGLSTKFTEAGVPNLRRVALMRLFGLRARLPYRLTEMAEDAVALLDALKIDKAHVVGASMGGMIAQLVAIGHADRVLSLTSIMSTTGNPRLPRSKPEALAALMNRPPADASMEDVIPFGVAISRAIGSPGYPAEETRLRERIERDYRRSFHPTGPGRQLAAIIDDGDRRKRLKGVKVPTLVIHGADDPLVPVEGGQDTAAAIPGAQIRIIPGMGHDIPVELVDEIADAIAGIAR
ncbi:pimeloyl-ACP methyl ester carboxylesterase [Novosphingobium kunmingense]|uniref:Pimeloyl-ACP methyl ester carboxylesterase n=1 Tax=Novosphingobium kunmingense TaxID=1211806 RepID=A0A2N0HJS7_9SPHN|nr:alpha/beta fold hydrolase [Novosphingobium kunmingense]PKB19197.1 pimeloyl-ACP methyl ester carboxylesterase [Novosphingobium kunmingense]